MKDVEKKAKMDAEKALKAHEKKDVKRDKEVKKEIKKKCK